MIGWTEAERPCTKRYTGLIDRMEWSSKRYFVWVDAKGRPIEKTGGWEAFYETPEQESEHKRCLGLRESAETQ